MVRIWYTSGVNMSIHPTVSVIIPTFNRSQYITEALDSVLDQTFTDYEILVIDDGSIDNTKEVLTHYMNKITYIYQENQGVSAARNTGIQHAHGKYIAFLDSDDMWLPIKLEKQVAILDEHSDIALVYTNVGYCDSNGEILKFSNKSKLFQSGYIPEKVLLWKVNCGYLQTWLIRKSCFDEVGLLDTSFKMSEDREISVRIALKYKICGLKEPLTIQRQHSPSQRLGRSPAEEREHYYFKFLDLLFSKYHDSEFIIKNKKKLIGGYYAYAGRAYLRDMNIPLARKRFWSSISSNPYQVNVYFFLFSTLFGTNSFRVAVKIRKLIMALKIISAKYRYIRYLKNPDKKVP